VSIPQSTVCKFSELLRRDSQEWAENIFALVQYQFSKAWLDGVLRTCLMRYAAATADWSSVISICSLLHTKILWRAVPHADREGILVSDALLPRAFVSYLRGREDHARVQQQHAGACIFVSSCIQAVLVPSVHSLNFERCSSRSRRRKALVLCRETRGFTPWLNVCAGSNQSLHLRRVSFPQ